MQIAQDGVGESGRILGSAGLLTFSLSVVEL